MGYSLSGQTSDQVTSGVEIQNTFGGLNKSKNGVSSETVIIAAAVIFMVMLLKGRK